MHRFGDPPSNPNYMDSPMKRYERDLAHAKVLNEQYLQHLKDQSIMEQGGEVMKALPAPVTAGPQQIFLADKIAGTLMKSTTFKKGDFVKKIADLTKPITAIVLMVATDFDVINHSGKNEEYYVLTMEE